MEFLAVYLHSYANMQLKYLNHTKWCHVCTLQTMSSISTMRWESIGWVFIISRKISWEFFLWIHQKHCGFMLTNHFGVRLVLYAHSLILLESRRSVEIHLEFTGYSILKRLHLSFIITRSFSTHEQRNMKIKLRSLFILIINNKINVDTT